MLTNGGEIYADGKIFFMDEEKAIDISLVGKNNISIITSQGHCYVLDFKFGDHMLILYSGLNYIIQHITLDQTQIFLTAEGNVYTTQYHNNYTYGIYRNYAPFTEETRQADIIGYYNNVLSKNKTVMNIFDIRGNLYYYKIAEKIIQMTSEGHLLTEDGSVFKIDHNRITVELLLRSTNIKKIFPYYNDFVYIDHGNNLYDSDSNPLDYKNVIEVMSGYDKIYILDNEMNLNIYDGDEETLETFNLLKSNDYNLIK